jgi:hypothetical protein
MFQMAIDTRPRDAAMVTVGNSPLGFGASVDAAGAIVVVVVAALAAGAVVGGGADG